MSKMERFTKMPNGVILVTGPTGSGKTTTLYSALMELNRPDKKIITALHQPPYDITKWAYHAWEEKYSPFLTDLLQQYKVEHVFMGDGHVG